MVRPVSSAAVPDTYHLDIGNLVVDLTDVRDPQELDGRVIQLSAGVGQIDIEVPADVTVEVDAHVRGPGGISLFGQDSGGVDTTVDRIHTGWPRRTPPDHRRRPPRRRDQRPRRARFRRSLP